MVFEPIEVAAWADVESPPMARKSAVIADILINSRRFIIVPPVHKYMVLQQ